MTLTPTQREYLTGHLKVTPRKKKILHRRSDTEVKDDKLTGAFDDYLKHEAKVLESIRKLETIPSSGKLVAGLEGEVSEIQKRLKSASRDDAATVMKQAYKDLDVIRDKAGTTVRTAVQNHIDTGAEAVDTLKKHAQAAFVTKATGDAATDLEQARTHLKNTKSKSIDPDDFQAAIVCVNDAMKKCAAGTKTADTVQDFFDDRAKVVLDYDATVKQAKKLEKHVQKAHITDFIDYITNGPLKDADTHLKATATKYEPATLQSAKDSITEAKQWCSDAKAAADDFQKYVAKRAVSGAVLAAVKGVISDATRLNNCATSLNDGDTLASPAVRDFVQATQKIEAVRTNLSDTLIAWYVTANKNRVKNLKLKPANAFIREDIKKIDERIKQAETELNAAATDGNKWRKAILTGEPIMAMAQSIEKVADRRKPFDDQLKLAKTAIGEMKKKEKVEWVGKKIEPMNKRVDDAEKLANRATLQIEEGLAALKVIAQDCAAVVKAAPDAESCAQKRKEATEKLEKLVKASVDSLKSTCEAIQKQLDASIALTPEGKEDWAGALKIVERALKDIGDAEGLNKESAGVQDLGKTKGNAEEMNKAIGELRKKAKAAGDAEHGKLVAEDLKRAGTSLDAAEKEVKESRIEGAAAPLKAAADEIVAACQVQAQHARFLELRKTVDDEREKIAKYGTAAAIKEKIDAIVTAVSQADEKDKSRDFAGAVVAIHAAEQAVKVAEETHKLREKFDTAAKEVDDAIKANKKFEEPTKENLAIKKHIADAGASAAAPGFDFAEAHKQLDQASAKIEAVEARKLAHAKPLDAGKLLASAQKIMASGGGKVLDELIKALPERLPFDVLKSLGKARFGGLEIKSDPGSELVSGKKILEMLSKVPDHVIGNPSLKKVERREPDKNGGFYRGSEELVVMNGRPGQSPQKFGSKQLNIRNQPQLPGDVELICQPTDEEDIDYFDFATVHEVGHAVDDRTHFMANHAGDPKFGGWQAFGGNIDKIAGEVAKWAEYDETAEQKQYVLDVVLGNKPTPPVPAPEKKTDWDKAQKKVDDWYAIATGGNVWWSQPDSEFITMKDGMIYHEAYDRQWYGYLAEARKKGITGYQFRAPGEWFAELYSAFRLKKLKPGHPAEEWLSKLKV